MDRENKRVLRRSGTESRARDIRASVDGAAKDCVLLDMRSCKADRDARAFHAYHLPPVAVPVGAPADQRTDRGVVFAFIAHRGG
jgi:hypothetical protein